MLVHLQRSLRLRLRLRSRHGLLPPAGLFAFVAVLLGGGVGSPAAPLDLVLLAGDHDRDGTPVSWEPPAGFDAKALWRLIRREDGKEVPLQLAAGERPAVSWILEAPLPRGARRAYRLEAAAPKAAPGVEWREEDGKRLLLRFAGKDVLRYNFGVIEPPAGVEPLFARSGYIHPVWSPSGKLLSNDFPLNHKHHHGLWMPWTETVFEGRKVDFWNTGSKLGKVECTSVDEKVSGPVWGGFRARHRFLDLTAPGGPKPVLNEVWDVRVYARGGPYHFDFASVQECAGPSPLLLKKYRYGGFGFRGSLDWEGADGADFLTSEGKTRADGHESAARWCVMRGKVGGETAGVAFLCHPQNFRAPQNMRIHPTEPFFNFAPCQAGDFEIKPGEPYVSRYRIVLHDGAASAAEVERLWIDYAHPPEVKAAAGG